MTSFEFNPAQYSFPLIETAQPAVIPHSKPIQWRLWRLDLIYVYPLGMEMVDGVQKEQSCFRRAYSCHVAAIDEQAIISLHESGFFRDLSWEPVAHDKQKQKKYTNVYRLPTIKPIDGWFQYDYVLDLAEGTENNYTVIR